MADDLFSSVYKSLHAVMFWESLERLVAHAEGRRKQNILHILTKKLLRNPNTTFRMVQAYYVCCFLDN